MVTANGPGRPPRGSIYHDYYVRVRGTSGLEILLNFICAVLLRSPRSLPFPPSPFCAPGLLAAPGVVTREWKAGGGVHEERTAMKITSEENKAGGGEDTIKK